MIGEHQSLKPLVIQIATGTVDTTIDTAASATATAETVASQVTLSQTATHCGTLLHVLERQLII